MPEPPIEKFFTGAKSLSGSPLGIIALFILLVYGFAALTFGLSVAQLGEDRIVIVWFLVSFPVLVLLIFTFLVIRYHRHLYGPSDFLNQADFLELQRQLNSAQKENSLLKEVSDVAIVGPALKLAGASNSLLAAAPALIDDPQKGRWGGKWEANGYKIIVGKITPLKTDSDYFDVPLEVVSIDPTNRPLTGVVCFYLHPTFQPDVEQVRAKNNTAKLNLISYGAFTVGAETEDGIKLELDLADPSIDAPARFKQG